MSLGRKEFLEIVQTTILPQNPKSILISYAIADITSKAYADNLAACLQGSGCDATLIDAGNLNMGRGNPVFHVEKRIDKTDFVVALGTASYASQMKEFKGSMLHSDKGLNVFFIKWASQHNKVIPLKFENTEVSCFPTLLSAGEVLRFDVNNYYEEFAKLLKTIHRLNDDIFAKLLDQIKNLNEKIKLNPDHFKTITQEEDDDREIDDCFIELFDKLRKNSSERKSSESLSDVETKQPGIAPSATKSTMFAFTKPEPSPQSSQPSIQFSSESLASLVETKRNTNNPLPTIEELNQFFKTIALSKETDRVKRIIIEKSKGPVIDIEFEESSMRFFEHGGVTQGSFILSLESHLDPSEFIDQIKASFFPNIRPNKLSGFFSASGNKMSDKPPLVYVPLNLLAPILQIIREPEKTVSIQLR